MIIVLLLFFQSICRYCQRLVLHIHDRWVNPKNVRLLKEAAESSTVAKQLFLHQQIGAEKSKSKTRKRYTTTASSSGVLCETCRFCANTPQGYCRHHFHLQELQVQRQQQGFWNPLGGIADRSNEHRQLRKIKRELKRNLKNRLNVSHLQQQQQQQQPPEEAYNTRAYSRQNSNCSSLIESGYRTGPTSSLSTSVGLDHCSSIDSGFSSSSFAESETTADSGIASTPPCVETTYYFAPLRPSLSSSLTTPSATSMSGASFNSHSTISTTYL